jgi:ketosteroid isomerase-like protein
MKTKPFVSFVCCALLAFALIGTVPAAETKIEQALRDLDAQWSAAAAAKDLDKTVAYYSGDAVVLPPNEAGATTRKAIRKAWKGTFAVTVSGSWKATRVEVARSGDLAWISGTYDWVSKDASGQQVKDHGKYLEVWEKQAGGTWKCGADIWNSDLPAVAPAPVEKK